MMMKFALLISVLSLALSVHAFQSTAFLTRSSHSQLVRLSLSEKTPEQPASVESDSAPGIKEEDDDDTLEKMELLRRGRSKAKRGRRKGSSATGEEEVSTAPKKRVLGPEDVFYEGPPAISETFAPTASILTVVGIIPAAASWARQAWVRYKITNRRIRVTSGLGGKDVAEIVYPDIVELRTAKRLFGDGDLVAFMRDGAKFEMRSVPEFEKTVEYILNLVDPEVAKTYREKGDVTNPNPENVD